MRIFGYEIRKVKTNLTCLHPQVKTLTEFAFEIDGKEYHQFKSLFDMPAPRYQRIQEFVREAEMRLTSEDLLYTFKKTKEHLNKGEITDAIILQSKAENLATQYIETDTFYRLFTCLFFDLDEDIGETNDIAGANPDVVNHLLALAEKAREDLGDAATGRKGSNVRPVGRL